MQVNIVEGQYQQLARIAVERGVSMEDAVKEALEAWMRSAARQERYARLSRKQARWRAHPTDLTALRLDLIYHSEALEGSPLTKEQTVQAVQELSPQ